MKGWELSTRGIIIVVMQYEATEDPRGSTPR